MRNAIKYHSDDLLHFYVIYEAENADNARRSEYYLMANSVKFMQQTTLTLSKGDSSVCT